MDILGVTAYSYTAIPKEVTSDGWAVIVDGAARAAALKGKGSSDANYVAAGGLAQRQGRSAIDNTVLRNVLMPLEARELLVGRRLRKAVCKFFTLRQVCMLRRLSKHLRLDLSSLAAKDATSKEHSAARIVLHAIKPMELAALGMDPGSLCLRQLRQRGTVIAGFGQFDAADQKAVWEVARRLINPNHDVSGGVEPRADSPDIFERLVAWCRDRPGEFFEKNKARHIEVKIAGMVARKIVVVRRSAMERFVLARYFPLYWDRAQPLWGVFASEPVQVRRERAAESSHVRANECPYAGCHGMALSGGSQADEAGQSGKSRRQSHLLTELGWVRDPAANIENWFLTDIEKILQEAWQLNPHGPAEMRLPGEMCVSVGQNPKVGSSIKETQHTQICEGSVASYPVLQLASQARFSKRLGAWLDLVDIAPSAAAAEMGGCEDACGAFLRLATDRPTAPAFLEFLISLRLSLLCQFGGGQALDFLVLAMSDDRGGFSVLFAPLPQLLKLGDEKPDFAQWANPFTGESSESTGLEEARVDVGKGVGHFLVAKPALREQLLAGGEDVVRRIWAFNRVPGMREAMRSFIQERDLF